MSLSNDTESVRTWLREFEDCVRRLDFDAAEPMFAEDAYCFGSRADVMRSRAELIARQWKLTWSSTSDFRFDMDSLQCRVSSDGLLACAVATWTSTGFEQGGKSFRRPGRVTILLHRASREEPWRAVHSHYSLFPGIPVISHGQRQADA